MFENKFPSDIIIKFWALILINKLRNPFNFEFKSFIQNVTPPISNRNDAKIFRASADTDAANDEYNLAKRFLTHLNPEDAKFD